MQTVQAVLCSLIISLLIAHEMDAIRAKEWKMFLILKDMADETAYRAFTLAHLPLYAAVILLLTLNNSWAHAILFFVIDTFVIAHAALHFGFRKHPNNGFTSIFSMLLIYGPGILALAHLFLASRG